MDQGVPQGTVLGPLFFLLVVVVVVVKDSIHLSGSTKEYIKPNDMKQKVYRICYSTTEVTVAFYEECTRHSRIEV